MSSLKPSIHFLMGMIDLGVYSLSYLLCEAKVLSAPVLYSSLYLKQHRQTYYRLLQEVRTDGSWETWLEFFLKGVESVSRQAVKTIHEINELFAKDTQKIQNLGRARFSCAQVLDYLKQLPQVTVSHLVEVLDITSPTARSALNKMVELGILRESSGKKRDKVYVYSHYLTILEKGAEPF